MAIWSSEIKELEKLYESFKGPLPDLEKELERLIKAVDENMILLYSRRCLEVIITDLCECELKRPRKTEPLKGIIDKLHKEDKVPAHIITSMHGLNELSTYGAHPKDFDPEQVKPVLVNLDIIIKWYLKYKQIATIGRTEVEEETVQLRKAPLKEVKIEERTAAQEKPAKAGKRKLMSIVTLTVILIITAILAYPKIFKRNTLERLRSSGERISVAVMPFQNMTNDTIWNVWQDGIQNELITSLTNSEELKVRQTESINPLIQSRGLTNYASLTPSVASTISQKLDANIFVYGSIKQADTTIRVNAQLIDSNTKEIYKSFQVDGTKKEIFKTIDSLSTMVKNFLIVSNIEKDVPTDFLGQYVISTKSPDAYRYFMYGQKAYYNMDFPSAINWYFQALAIDSTFVGAMQKISNAYSNQGMYEKGKEWCIKYYRKMDIMTMQQQLWANYFYAWYFKTLNEAIKYLEKLKEIDDQQPIIYYSIGDSYLEILQYDKAIPEFEKALEIYKKWDIKPLWSANYSELGVAYHKTGQYKKEKELYKKAEKDFPYNSDLINQYARLAITEGDTVTANRYFEKWISILRGQSLSESQIAVQLGNTYAFEDVPDKAEEYYQKALSLEPENPLINNILAYFLIDKDRNINEGMELIEKALKLSPENYNYLHTEGWGLYKQGKYQEALELLQKSWDLRPIYRHRIFLHLEAAKKAVANQKNN